MAARPSTFYNAVLSKHALCQYFDITLNLMGQGPPKAWAADVLEPE